MGCQHATECCRMQALLLWPLRRVSLRAACTAFQCSLQLMTGCSGSILPGASVAASPLLANRRGRPEAEALWLFGCPRSCSYPRPSPSSQLFAAHLSPHTGHTFICNCRLLVEGGISSRISSRQLSRPSRPSHCTTFGGQRGLLKHDGGLVCIELADRGAGPKGHRE